MLDIFHYFQRVSLKIMSISTSRILVHQWVDCELAQNSSLLICYSQSPVKQIGACSWWALCVFFFVTPIDWVYYMYTQTRPRPDWTGPLDQLFCACAGLNFPTNCRKGRQQDLQVCSSTRYAGSHSKNSFEIWRIYNMCDVVWSFHWFLFRACCLAMWSDLLSLVSLHLVLLVHLWALLATDACMYNVWIL